MASAKKKATQKKTKTSKGRKTEFGAKAEFIRALPLDMPVKQVIEEAAKKGLTLSDNHVYAVRSEERKKKGKDKPTPKRSIPKKRAAASRAPSSSPKSGSLEVQLRMAIAELGLARARAIFAEVEKAFAGS